MVFDSLSTWCTPIVLFCVSNLIIATLFITSKSSNTKTTKKHDDDQDQVNRNAYLFGFRSRIPRVSSFLERAKSINVSYIIPDIVIAKLSPPDSPSNTKTAKFTSLSRLAQSIFFTCSYDNQPDSKRYPSNKPKPTFSLLERLKSIDISSIYNTNTNTNESEDISDSVSKIVDHRVNSVKMSYTPPLGVPINRSHGQHEGDKSYVKVKDRWVVPRFESKTSATDSRLLTTEPDGGDNSVKMCTLSKSEKRPMVRKTVVEVRKSRSEVRVLLDDDEDFDLCRPESARGRRNADDDAKADKFIHKFREQLKLQRLDSLGRYNDMLRRPT